MIPWRHCPLLIKALTEHFLHRKCSIKALALILFTDSALCNYEATSSWTSSCLNDCHDFKTEDDMGRRREGEHWTSNTVLEKWVHKQRKKRAQFSEVNKFNSSLDAVNWLFCRVNFRWLEFLVVSETSENK